MELHTNLRGRCYSGGGIAMGRPHAYYDARSLMLHRMIAVRLRETPELLAVGRTTLERWKCVSPNPGTDEEWTVLLASELESVIEAITADTDEGQRIRQSSPLLSVLSVTERDVIRAYAEAEHLATLADEKETISHDV